MTDYERRVQEAADKAIAEAERNGFAGLERYERARWTLSLLYGRAMTIAFEAIKRCDHEQAWVQLDEKAAMYSCAIIRVQVAESNYLHDMLKVAEDWLA